MALEKIIQFLKSPIFLISLSLITLSVIYVVVTKTPQVTTSTVGPKCPSGIAITCPDGTLQCGENCPVNQQWDCSTKKCICAGANDKLCVNNTQCCNPCDNDICCSESNQITKNGVKSCCPPGTQPGKSSSSSTVNDMCAVPCGNTVCNEGEECIKVTNLKQTTYDNLVRTKGSELAGSDPTTNTLTFCAPPSTCQFGDEQAYPPSQDNAYPYLNNLPTSVCIAQDSLAKSSPCFSKTGKSDCNNTAGCTFLNLPDDFNPALQNQINNYMNSKSTNGSSPYYCDPNGLSLGRLVQYRSSTGNCSWQDCIQQISSAGTIDTVWNDNTQTCTAYKVPPYENIGSQPLQKIQCTGSGSPCSSCGSNTDFVSGIKCTAPGFPCSNCQKEGDYVCIQDGDVCEPVSSGGSGTNNWTFNKCAPPDSNGNKVQVLGPGGGNCPWGCSSTSGIGLGGGNCYNTDIPPGSGNVFGDVNPGTTQVCLQNGQIANKPQEPIYAFDSSFTCNVVASCPSGTYCQNSLCSCIFKPQQLLVPNFIPNASYEIATPAFCIYSIINNQIYWLSTIGQVTCARPTSYVWKMVSDYRTADLFSLSTAGFHGGIGIWWYGTQGYNNQCGGAVPLLINYNSSGTSGNLCVNSQDSCSGYQGNTDRIAYFWDRTINSSVSTGTIRCNKGYNITCDYTASNVIIIDTNTNNQLAVGTGNSVLFYVIPSTLLSANFNCTVIPN